MRMLFRLQSRGIAGLQSRGIAGLQSRGIAGHRAGRTGDGVVANSQPPSPGRETRYTPTPVVQGG
jgi:hypothetical protein